MHAHTHPSPHRQTNSHYTRERRRGRDTHGKSQCMHFYQDSHRYLMRDKVHRRPSIGCQNPFVIIGARGNARGYFGRVRNLATCKVALHWRCRHLIGPGHTSTCSTKGVIAPSLRKGARAASWREITVATATAVSALSSPLLERRRSTRHSSRPRFWRWRNKSGALQTQHKNLAMDPRVRRGASWLPPCVTDWGKSWRCANATDAAPSPAITARTSDPSDPPDPASFAAPPTPLLPLTRELPADPGRRSRPCVRSCLRQVRSG